ncbi:MAG TPA: hypothetical protein VMT70_18165 [Vicinamibacteria bacterium]|nr:hypothetical protein [Vicinamibacteria bacterium]
MSPTARRSLAVAALGASFAAARAPLHRATFALPVSNDDAILLLMGRHVLRGELSTTLWNQPYNGALDAYLLAPLLAFLPHHLAYRLYEIVSAVLLVVLVGLLARRLGGTRAGWAGALLASCGTPYMALMTATGPPPNFLMPLVTGLPLLAALAACPSSGGRPGAAPPGGTRLGVVIALGVVSGLAVWNSSLAVPAFVGMGAGLGLAGLRPAPRPAVASACGFAIGASPLAVARLTGASGARVVTAASAVTAVRPRWLWGEGWLSLGHALRGLAGLQVPLVVDGKERAPLPLAVAFLLAAGLLVAVAAGCRSRRALPLLGWAGALAGAFWLSRRTGPDELRYLYGLNAPVLALAGAGLAALWTWRRAAAAAIAAALLLPWAYGTHVLAERWSDPLQPASVWEVPTLDPVLGALRATGSRSAYASLQFAGRITLETKGDVVASQAWNERIPGDPLRFRDEVDLDPAPAWVLSPRFSRGMLRAGGFRDLLRTMGGSFEETEVGADASRFSVFHGFRPPYEEDRPVPSAFVRLETTAGAPLGPAVLDRDPATAWTAAEGLGRGSGVVVEVAPSRRLSALVLAVDLDASPLAVPWVASIGGAVVAQGPARSGFQWVNGAPRAGKQAVVVVPLGDREAGEVRLVFQGPGPPLSIAEAFVYGPDEDPRPAAGAASARDAYASARAGRWDEAVRLYAEAVRLEPDRASHHAAWARARWRAAHRRWLDVESLDDGGPDLVDAR